MVLSLQSRFTLKVKQVFKTKFFELLVILREKKCSIYLSFPLER